MSRTITLVGYVLLATALALQQLAALRALRAHHARRSLTFGEFLVAVARRHTMRWPLLGGWLWLGWHLFARGNWR
jgi:hypothetical protein